MIGFLANCRVSRQAVRECARKATAFMALVLQKLMGLQAYGPAAAAVPKALQGFNRVLIVDSTTVALPPALAPFYPGAANPNAAAPPAAQLKIQAYYDMLTERFVHFTLSSFRKNDQAASPDILALCRPNDLILRDLGYFALKVFKQLNELGCFFVSRLKTGTSLLCAEDHQVLDPVKLLHGKALLDRPLKAGKKDRVPVRLIAIKLPQNVADERRRKHKQNRDKRLRYTRRTAFLLGYEIFITNLPRQHFSPSQILSFYGLRWRIEILFKAFKQHLNLAQVKENTLYQAEKLIYARLILITFMLNFVYAPIRNYSPKGFSSTLSILKFSSWFDLIAPSLLLLSVLPKEQLLPRWLKQIPAHCLYDKRCRPHFLDCFYSLT